VKMKAGALPVEVCQGGRQITMDVAGKRVATGGWHNQAAPSKGYWEVQGSSGPFTSMTFQINSVGPYEDELIAKLCASNPDDIALDGVVPPIKNKCSSWIVVGDFIFDGPG
jgi:hypothetical protein